MKTIVSLIFIALLTNFMKAQDLGKVVIHNATLTNPKFIVSLNGIRQNNQYTNDISFDYLDEYTYRVKILLMGVNGALTFTITSSPNYMTVYALNKDAYGNYALILESKTVLGLQSPQTNTIVVTPTVNPFPNNGNNNGNNGNTNNNQNIVTNQEFAGICDAIAKESFESTKLEMTQSIFGTRKISSAQALTFVKLFSMEKNKLDVSKTLYTKTYDKQNYYKVYDAFSFSSSKKELSAFIKANP